MSKTQSYFFLTLLGIVDLFLVVCSVEDIGVVVLVEETHVLRLSNPEAVKKIVSIGSAKLLRGLK